MEEHAADYITRLRHRLETNFRKRRQGAEHYSNRRKLIVEVAFFKHDIGHQGVVDINASLAFVHPDVVKAAGSNSAIKYILHDFAITTNGISRLCERVSYRDFVEYYKLMSLFTEHESRFEKNVVTTWGVTQEDIASYILNAQAKREETATALAAEVTRQRDMRIENIISHPCLLDGAGQLFSMKSNTDHNPTRNSPMTQVNALPVVYHKTSSAAPSSPQLNFIAGLSHLGPFASSGQFVDKIETLLTPSLVAANTQQKTVADISGQTKPQQLTKPKSRKSPTRPTGHKPGAIRIARVNMLGQSPESSSSPQSPPPSRQLASVSPIGHRSPRDSTGHPTGTKLTEEGSTSTNDHCTAARGEMDQHIYEDYGEDSIDSSAYSTPPIVPRRPAGAYPNHVYQTYASSPLPSRSRVAQDSILFQQQSQPAAGTFRLLEASSDFGAVASIDGFLSDSIDSLGAPWPLSAHSSIGNYVESDGVNGLEHQYAQHFEHEHREGDGSVDTMSDYLVSQPGPPHFYRDIHIEEGGSGSLSCTDETAAGPGHGPVPFAESSIDSSGMPEAEMPTSRVGDGVGIGAIHQGKRLGCAESADSHDKILHDEQSVPRFISSEQQQDCQQQQQKQQQQPLKAEVNMFNGDAALRHQIATVSNENMQLRHLLESVSQKLDHTLQQDARLQQHIRLLQHENTCLNSAVAAVRQELEDAVAAVRQELRAANESHAASMRHVNSVMKSNLDIIETQQQIIRSQQQFQQQAAASSPTTYYSNSSNIKMRRSS